MTIATLAEPKPVEQPAAKTIDAAENMNCPVCGSSRQSPFATAQDWEYFTSDEAFAYLQCDTCQTVYLNHPPVDRLSEIYPDNYYSYASNPSRGSFIQSVKEWLDAKTFRKLLGRLPGDHLSVLDVGGGSGWLLTRLKELSPRVTETHEVDLNETARAAAEEAGHHFHCQRIEDFQPDTKFDLIIMLNLIEHVADPEAVLQSMKEMLAPGGMVLIKTPNVTSLDARLFRGSYWGGLHCPRHWVLFNKNSFTDLASRCGLRCAAASYTQGGWQWAASILGGLAKRKWINSSADKPLHTHPLFLPVSALMAGFDFLRLPFATTTQMDIILEHES